MVSNYGPPGLGGNSGGPVWNMSQTTNTVRNANGIHTPQQFNEAFPAEAGRLNVMETRFNQHKSENEAHRWVVKNDVDALRQRVEDLEVELFKLSGILNQFVSVVDQLVSLEESRTGERMEGLDLDEFQKELADPDYDEEPPPF